jgi:hypothetical protein
VAREDERRHADGKKQTKDREHVGGETQTGEHDPDLEEAAPGAVGVAGLEARHVSRRARAP